MKKKWLGYGVLLLLAILIFVHMGRGGMDHPFKSGEAFSIWIAAFLTLCIFSFLYDDNPLYRFAEHLFIGVSAAYWMVMGFWTVLIPNLIGRLAPYFVKKHFIPDINAAEYRDLLFLIPLILGLMLLMRLSPKAPWISRWPLALILGYTAGLRMIGFLQSDFIAQIRNTMMSIVVISNSGTFDWNALQLSFSALISVIGVITGLIYFFFSKEHKGMFGKASRVGVWVLMITFGAGFGYTVMGRIALLVGRMEFLYRDWLHLVQ